LLLNKTYLSRVFVLCAVLSTAACGGASKALIQGDRAMLDARYDDAIAHYQSAVGKGADERSAEALYRIAGIKADFQGAPLEAEKVLRELVARFAGTQAGYAGQVRLTELYRDVLHDSVRLVPAALRALEMKPDGERSPWLRLVLSEGYLARGDYDQARIEAGKILEDYSDSELVPRAALLSARSFELRGSVVEAQEQFREVERQFAGTRTAVEAKLGRARMLETRDELDRAEAMYIECLGYGGNRAATAARISALRERRERRLGGAPRSN